MTPHLAAHLAGHTTLAHSETDYNDHFETPPRAYADVLPLLRRRALEVASKKDEAAAASAAKGPADADANADADADADTDADACLRELVVYDPYYCQVTTTVEQMTPSPAPITPTIDSHRIARDWHRIAL